MAQVQANSDSANGRSTVCRLHLIVFTDTYFETNGVGTFYRTMLRWCARHPEYRLSVFCPRRDIASERDAPENVHPIRGSIQFPNPFYKDLAAGYFPIRRLCRQVASVPGPKVIHIGTAGAMGATGAAIGRRLHVPQAGWYHTDLQAYGRLYGQSIMGRLGSLAGRLGGIVGERASIICEKYSYGHCAVINVASESSVPTVQRFFEGPIVINPCPLDMDRFQPGLTRDGDFRRKFNADGRVLVVVVGRVAREKNLDQVCELLGADPRINLVFVGDGPYAQVLRRKWNARVTGFLHGDALLSAYQQADVLVQLSTSETFGLSLVEALACGLPAVVRRGPGFAANIPANCGVEVLEGEDLPALADRCVALVRNTQRHAAAAQAVRELVRPISTDVLFPRIMAFHEACLGQPDHLPESTKRERGSAAA